MCSKNTVNNYEKILQVIEITRQTESKVYIYLNSLDNEIRVVPPKLSSQKSQEQCHRFATSRRCVEQARLAVEVSLLGG